MELKHIFSIFFIIVSFLLIVPYGIETFADSFSNSSKILLIVPYGIETVIPVERGKSMAELLIVPYGIETTVRQTLITRVMPF